MPKDTDSTIKFKADITDLKASMQEAGRYIRLANSEFKAATAGMNNWSKSADGLSAKTRQLNTILQAQKQQLAALETDYKKVVKEQGENSKGAEELKIKINNQKAAIGQTESQLDSYEKELKDVTKGTKDAGDTAEKAANGGFTVLKGAMADLVARGVTALAGGLKDLMGSLVDVGKQAVASYAEFEQLEGGVNKLFGDASDAVMKNAQNAFKTAGLSANDYMNTVTSFSASLISGLGGDTEKAAKIADMAIQDMSDNANTFGTDIQSIQNAYQGFAKGNFTMLDNLKLGYGGTQEEMARLINESGVMGDSFEATAKNVKDIPFDKMIEAINKTQERMGITGTTAKEASKTIEGSVNAMKGAWQNLLTGIADDNADFDMLMNNFIDSLMTALDNLLPRIKTVIGGMGKLITGLIEQLLPVAIDLINTELPNFLAMGGQLLTTLITGITQALPQLVTTGVQIITQLITGLSTAIPQLALLIVQVVPQIIQALLAQLPVFLQACITFLMAIVQAVPTIVQQISVALPQIIDAILNGLLQALPIILDGAVQLLNAIIEAIPIIIQSLSTALPQIIDTILNALIEALPMILDGAITLLMAIVEAIPTIVDSLVENLPKIINQIISSLIKALPQVLDAAITLLMALIDALPTIIRALVVELPRIINTITKTLIQNLPVIIKAAVQLFMGIIKAIPQITVELIKNMPEIISSIVEGLREGFDTVKEVGKDLIKGLWNGIKDMAGWIKEKITGFGKGVLDNLKNFFGIGSPSKLFEREIGKWLPPGITVGFEKAMPQAVKNMAASARDMAQDIANEMSVPLDDMALSAGQVKGIQSLNGATGSFGAESGVNGGNNKNIVFNQTINSPEPVNRLTVFRDTNSLLFSAGVKLNNV